MVHKVTALPKDGTQYTYPLMPNGELLICSTDVLVVAERAMARAKMLGLEPALNTFAIPLTTPEHLRGPLWALI